MIGAGGIARWPPSASALLLAARNSAYGLVLAPDRAGPAGAAAGGRPARARRVDGDGHGPEPSLGDRAAGVLGDGPRRVRVLEHRHARRGARRRRHRRSRSARARRRVPGRLRGAARPARAPRSTAGSRPLLGGAIALVLVPIAPPGVPIIAAGLAALVGLRTRPMTLVGGAGAGRRLLRVQGVRPRAAGRPSAAGPARALRRAPAGGAAGGAHRGGDVRRRSIAGARRPRRRRGRGRRGGVAAGPVPRRDRAGGGRDGRVLRAATSGSAA